MSNKIKFGDFQVTDEHRKSIEECLNSGWLTTGPRVEQLEKEFAGIFGENNYSTFVSSGTMALICACMSLYETVGAKPGDEVICPALSFIASATSIRNAGLVPRFVDVGWDLGIDVTKIEENINTNTKAILAVGLMGTPCKLDVIQEIAKKHNLVVILDSCESYGSKYKGKFELEYGDMMCTSHYICHICSCGTEGGNIVTKNSELDSLLKSIRSHGRPPGSLYFDHINWGTNGKNTDLQASIGLVEVKKFEEIFNRRKQTLYKYIDATESFNDLAIFTSEPEDCQSAPHAFNIIMQSNGEIEALKQWFLDAGIEYKRTFGCIPTQHRAFQDYGCWGEFPIAEYIGNNSIHIGLSQYYTADEVSHVCNSLRDFFLRA